MNNLPLNRLLELAKLFFKLGVIGFGGPVAHIAMIEDEVVKRRQWCLVDEYQWLTQKQLLDAVAIGQFTPGPVLSTATFIGYIISGLPGAVVATVGIFLPSFLFVAILNPLIPKLRASSWTRAFLDAVNVSAVALMVVTTLELGIATLTFEKVPYVDFFGLILFLISAVLAIRYQINAAWLVLGSGLVGWGVSFLGYY